MPKPVHNLYFEAQGNFRNKFHLKFPNKPGTNWIYVWSTETGIGHHSTGIKPILDMVKASPYKDWLSAGEIFKVECGAGGAVDYWGFNSPLYSEELVLGGTETISAELSGGVYTPHANFKVG